MFDEAGIELPSEGVDQLDDEVTVKSHICTLSIIAELQDEIISNQSKIEKQSQEINELEKQVAWFKQQFQLASLSEFGI